VTGARSRNVAFIAVAVVVLVAAATTVAVTHHGSILGLGRQPGASMAPPAAVVNQPPAPPPAAAEGSARAAAARRAPPRTSTRALATGRRPAAAAASVAKGYPGAVTCPGSDVPSPNLYAFECTHADGSPVRWSSNTIKVWADGLTPMQTAALEQAEGEWSPHTGIVLVPAPSASAAQVLLTEVPTLDALPDLGSDVVEYAVTDVHQTGGYYDRATVQVANAALLDAATWVDTMLHELGHVAGLAHVVDTNQIMRRVVGVPQTSYGDGDVAGLESERPS
jgi:hypothetical protein